MPQEMPERRRLQRSERNVRVLPKRSRQDVRLDVLLPLPVNGRRKGNRARFRQIRVQRMRIHFLLLCVIAACGGSTGGSGSTGDSGSPDSGSSSKCAFVGMLDDRCAMDSDCAFGIHQTDCCGNTAAVGFNHAERMRFDTLEPMCAASYPGCGCPPGPTRTDSGETALDASTILVACVSGGPARRCRTYVTMRPPDTP